MNNKDLATDRLEQAIRNAIFQAASELDPETVQLVVDGAVENALDDLAHGVSG